MEVNYQAVPYKCTIHHDATENCCPSFDEIETRYRIISIDSGDVLDDAQGYGYKTAQKAYAAYAYKTRDERKDKDRQQKIRYIQRWMKDHKDFIEAMDDAAFENAKREHSNRFDSNSVALLLKDFGLETSFSASELLKVWAKS